MSEESDPGSNIICLFVIGTQRERNETIRWRRGGGNGVSKNGGERPSESTLKKVGSHDRGGAEEKGFKKKLSITL